jgi:hypothetical protein
LLLLLCVVRRARFPPHAAADVDELFMPIASRHIIEVTRTFRQKKIFSVRPCLSTSFQ